ncbi:Protein of unknown function [Kaistia soli DSM 19436]|uniref:DUF2735 domain-containing protein n=1 Tax=Kaistia soli DSM 19436 TaxID=1122133 RepID=A0A1M4UNJ8_9HYPH|nr:DUF2735 domain-containing protein [Kaistia soli]SHE58264.1 Protein of unknown function [Kaistia soli DSM 19436]
MTASVQRQTAKIYEFPAGGRTARVRGLEAHLELTNIEREMASLPNTVYGDSWYHDVAIAEDETAGHH